MALLPTHQDRPDAAVLSPTDAGDWMTELSALLRELEAITGSTQRLPPVLGEAKDNQLIQVRLGVASSLFTALECRNGAAARHSLRVALICSAWSEQLQLDDGQRDLVELAALLHDVGVIGIPDEIVLKAGPLTPEESAVMAKARRMSLTILRRSCTSSHLLAIVEHVGAWYDGSRPEFSLVGKDIPRGSRMIAIVEAFDAMTTDHVYRPARSHERAMAELFECAGTQFDPVLVESFAAFHTDHPKGLHESVAHRWLNTLAPAEPGSCWSLVGGEALASPTSDAMFQGRLLDNMYDAVLFIDAAGAVTLWNRGAERLTGIQASSIRQRRWAPDLLNMTDERGHAISDQDCPVNCAIRSGVQSLRRLTICGRSGRSVSVDTHAIPVTTSDGTTLGAILLFHDASSEISLEQRCQSLHDKATKDSLTQVANRAEFDRVHEMFVAAHRQQQMPCSLIICDLDRFKSVNDTYGHQAGDEAIKSLASLLKSTCRPGDLVARYGGEEFVVLCADCNIGAATRRAEQSRKALCEISQPMMNGKTISASFGVTEVQPGDTPETMLRRADRALFQAKANGRNQVVQLGSGPSDEPPEEKKALFWPFQAARPQELLEQTLITPVPAKMAVEKLRGFVADHQAKILAIEGNVVRLEIEEQRSNGLRRLTDRPLTFQIEVVFDEHRLAKGESGEGIARTRIHVSISVRKSRDRRRDDVFARARDMLASFRSYLMASDDDHHGTFGKAKRLLAPWL